MWAEITGLHKREANHSSIRLLIYKTDSYMAVKQIYRLLRKRIQETTVVCNVCKCIILQDIIISGFCSAT